MSRKTEFLQISSFFQDGILELVSQYPDQAILIYSSHKHIGLILDTMETIFCIILWRIFSCVTPSLLSIWRDTKHTLSCPCQFNTDFLFKFLISTSKWGILIEIVFILETCQARQVIIYLRVPGRIL